MLTPPRFSTLLLTTVLAGVSTLCGGCTIDNRVLRAAPDSGRRVGAGPAMTGYGGKGGRPPGDGGRDTMSNEIVLTPDANGYYDGTNQAGVIGSWWATGDDYGSDGSPGTGNCPQAGFPNSECSSITSPTPGKPFAPDPGGRGMCTSGVAAAVLLGQDGLAAFSAIWGNDVGFDLNTPAPVDGGVAKDADLAEAGPTDSSAAVDAHGQPAASDASGPRPKGVYDVSIHRITGFAFDIDTPPPYNLRVEFQTRGTEDNPAYWDGTSAGISPLGDGGHFEIHWPNVGGPLYLQDAAPPFDPSTLEAIDFHVTTTTTPVPYSFCISSVVMLTD
jgi:hypothetical protein